MKSNQVLNKNVWKSFKRNGVLLKKNLNMEQIKEHDKIKKLSELVIMDNFDRNPTFLHIYKTNNGYSVSKQCSFKNKKECNWTFKINIKSNEAIIACDKNCQHKNPIKHKSLILILYLFE